jgi:hypothetical protein
VWRAAIAVSLIAVPLAFALACHGDITPVEIEGDAGVTDGDVLDASSGDADSRDAGAPLGYDMRCLKPSKVPTVEPPAIANAPYKPSVSA